MMLSQSELAQLVNHMRTSQKAFFRNKNTRERSERLLESKELEVQVDAAVKEILEAKNKEAL